MSFAVAIVLAALLFLALAMGLVGAGFWYVDRDMRRMMTQLDERRREMEEARPQGPAEGGVRG